MPLSQGLLREFLKECSESNEMHYLIIEEINRGNAPAIFGDIFQLLDRNDDGTSKYWITNKDLRAGIHWWVPACFI